MAKIEPKIIKKSKILSESHKAKIAQSLLGHKSFFPEGYIHSLESNLKRSETMKKVRAKLKEKYSQGITKRYKNPLERKKTSKAVKIAMRLPHIRNKHLNGLLSSPWRKVRTDKGQLELLEKWNKLGFQFIPNYQFHKDDYLFYIDGYDPEKNVIIEFDSKYHHRKEQQLKDQERANIIILSLHPKKFWRYDAVNKQYTQLIKN